MCGDWCVVTRLVCLLVTDALVHCQDYYCHTAFEFEVSDTNTSGPIGTILAGGRYDGLMKELGGPDHCGVGA